jgi:hypothetical protein
VFKLDLVSQLIDQYENAKVTLQTIHDLIAASGVDQAAR